MPIQVNHVFYTYNKKTSFATLALDDISLTINDNDFVALVGETGSGKSTLVQHFNALLLPDEGDVKVFDYVVNNKKNKKNAKLREKVGLVFQFPEYQLFEETVLKDVMYGPKNFGKKEDEAKEISIKALKSVGLDESYFERSPFELSGGEKRRVAIAGILAINPDILVLDEPTVGLDPAGAKAIMHLIKEIHESGKTIILVSHELEAVCRFANKVIYIDKGKVAFEGQPFELFKNKNFDIEVPRLFELALKLNEKGFDIPLDQIRSSDDVIKLIKERVSK